MYIGAFSVVFYYDKPRYIPSKEELLKYKDNGYSEPTPQKAALATYLAKKLGSEETADRVLRELMLMIRREPYIRGQEIMDFFDQSGIVLKNLDDAQTLMDLYADFSNNTRMQANNGHTPEELANMASSMGEKVNTGRQRIVVAGDEVENTKSDPQEIRAGILDALAGMSGDEDLRKKLTGTIDQTDSGTGPVWSGNLIAPQKIPKVGRNDPCPCGSGKKYKKCHGRSGLTPDEESV